MISFSQEIYTESEGSGSVEVCAELEGDLELPEDVQVLIRALESDGANAAIGNGTSVFSNFPL